MSKNLTENYKSITLLVSCNTYSVKQIRKKKKTTTERLVSGSLVVSIRAHFGCIIARF